MKSKTLTPQTKPMSVTVVLNYLITNCTRNVHKRTFWEHLCWQLLKHAFLRDITIKTF